MVEAVHYLSSCYKCLPKKVKQRWLVFNCQALLKAPMKFLLIAFIFTGISCSKEKSCEACIGQVIEKDAMIIDTGSPAVDGCSWLVKIDSSHIYHPDVLDSSFKQHQLQVKITYDITGEKFLCSFRAQIPIIHVIDIRK